MENLQDELEKLRKENELLKRNATTSDQKRQKKQEKNKKRLSWTWKMFTGANLSNSFSQWFTEYHTKDKVSPDTSAGLLTALVKRFVRVRLLSLILLLFSLLPALVSLYILVKQNDLIHVQNSLVEGSRKSSYGFQLVNIFDAVDNKGINSGTIARIVGLSHSLKPYKVLQDNGELSKKLYSPERTQLLLFIINATNISNESKRKIFESADFSYCDLRNMNLSDKYLSGANLANSNFENATLNNANLNAANLSDAILTGIRFSKGYAVKTNFKKAQLNNALLRYTDFQKSTFIETNLNASNMQYANLQKACFTDATLNNSNIDNTKLSDAYFNGSFNLSVDSKNFDKGNLSEDYYETNFKVIKDDDGFKTIKSRK